VKRLPRILMVAVEFGLWTALVGAVCVCFLVLMSKSHYPYGREHCCDKQLMLALTNYSQLNKGYFPSGGGTPEASLSLLYPTFADAGDLRGKTFSEEAARKLLEAGKPLTPETCGWHYVDGLKYDQANAFRIAIFWDKIGLGHNSERLPAGGHTVGFMDGHTAVIREADWQRFLTDQEAAWADIRAGRTPKRPWLPEQ